VFTPLNGLDQFQRGKEFSKMLGMCAGHRDSGHYFDVDGIRSEKISASVVGLNSGDDLGD
jgi:hypothetical protein